MAESCRNDSGDDDDVGGGDGRRKVDCEGKTDDYDGDNDKGDCDDDADGGGGNNNDDGGVHGDGICENWCVYGEGGDEADDDDEQTESVADDLAEYNGRSKMEMTVGIMRWRILKETQR